MWEGRRGSYQPCGAEETSFNMLNGRRGSVAQQFIQGRPEIQISAGPKSNVHLGQWFNPPTPGGRTPTEPCPPGPMALDGSGFSPLRRRRSLPKTPKKHSPVAAYRDNSDEATPSMVWDGQAQAYLPHHQIKKTYFDDQFDQYLYQSRHISTPVIPGSAPGCAPELVLEIPSDSDSSRRPSAISVCPSDSRSVSPALNSPRLSQARLEIEGLVIPGAVRIRRRASHCGELMSPVTTDTALPTLLEVPRARSRGSSLPENIGTEELYRLRNFSISGKKVINRGDSFRSRSKTSLNSSFETENHSGYGTESPHSKSRDSISGSRKSSLHSSRATSRLSRRSSFSPQKHTINGQTNNIYRVLMLGAAGVGKTSICAQFLSSDHINTYDRAAVEAEDGVEKEVSVSINNKESRVVFIDHQHGDMSLENMMLTYVPSAYLVVAAVDDKSSFDQADRILAYLRMSGEFEDKPVILVANKTDLVRKRVVKTAVGKSVAVRFGIKYIETSPGINHNIDELLVGVLHQISLRESNSKKKSPNKVINFFSRVLNLSNDETSACSNLTIP